MGQAQRLGRICAYCFLLGATPMALGADDAEPGSAIPIAATLDGWLEDVGTFRK
jgi:hypothetical protein